MTKILKTLVAVVALLAVLVPAGLVVASSVDVMEYPSGSRYYPGDEIIEERGRASRTYYEGNGTYRAEFVGSPEFTRSITDDSWVEYGFTDYGDFYSVQHPWSSVTFYDYYTEVWNEEFTEVKIYDDRWVVEYKNKKGNWVDADFYGITRSYEEVADGIKLKRTGNTDIGQRQDIYFFRNGSPCKIEIRQTCDEARDVRFVWKPSGIVADSEKELKSFTDNLTIGLNFYDSGGNFVQAMRWYEEWETCDTITYIAETHAQGRKATVTFSEFSVSAGGTAILDPMTFYPDADPETSSGDSTVAGDTDGLSGRTWNLMHDHAGTFAWPANDQMDVQLYSWSVNGEWQRHHRIHAGFDTSGLPDICTIIAATESFYGFFKVDGGGWTPSLNVYAGSPTDPADIVVADYEKSHFGTTAYCDTAITYANWLVANPFWNSFVFNATGIAAISKTGITGTSLRMVEYDVADNQPAWAALKQTYIQCHQADKGAGFKPTLVVTYTAPPTVVTDNATGVGTTTATLSGNVTAINDGSIVERGFVWDTDNQSDPGNVHPASSNYTWHWTEVGLFGTGVFSHSISGLSSNTTYYFRAGANNTAFWAYGNELSFMTPLGLPDAPTDFEVTQTDIDSANLTWIPGTDSATTVIRVATDGCPTSPTDGYPVYDGSGNSTSVDGLSLGVSTYYFSAWGYNVVGYSDDYICGSIGGDDMTLIAMALFCMVPIGFMAVAYYFNKRAIAFCAAGFAIVVGGLGFISVEGVGDIYFIIGWVGVGMAIVFALLGAAISEPTTGAEDPNLDYSSYDQKKRRWADRQRKQSESTKPRSRGRLRY